MLRFLIKCVLVAVIGSFIYSSIEPETRAGIKKHAMQVVDLVRGSGSSGGGSAHDRVDSPVGKGNAVVGRAYHHPMPNDCMGEKVINLDGTASCEQGGAFRSDK